MFMSLTDFEQIIRTYMEQILVEQYPEVGLSGSTLLDLTINPLLQITKPLILLLNKLDILQSLDNASLMTAEELDAIGIGNYGIARVAGARASGYVYVEMEPQYVGPEPVIIYPIVAATADGLKFGTNTNTIIKYSETDNVLIEGTVVPGVATDYLNSSTGKYEFPVRVEAEEAGEEYNVEANTVTTLVTTYPLLTGVVTNKTAFDGGVARESNVEYAARLKRRYLSSTAGTNYWYRDYFMSLFPNIYDMYVAGMGDRLMQRDRIIIRENGVFTEKHIGGKVDLYIKGSDTASYTQVSYINSDKVRLLNGRLKEDTAIVINNITNPSNNDLSYVLTYEVPETREGWVEVQVVAGPSMELPSTGDELEIRYVSYVDESYTDTFVYIQRFFYQMNKIRVERTPFKIITAIKNVTTDTDIPTDVVTVNTILPTVEVATCPDQTGVDADRIKLNPEAAVQVDNYYKGHTITLLSGTGAGQQKTILSFDITTGEATVDSEWDTMPNDTTVYSITNYTNNVENSARDIIDLEFDGTAINPDTGNAWFSAGDLLNISYMYNKLITDVQDRIDMQEARAIAADVLAREALPSYVYMGMQVRCKYGKLLSAEQRVYLQQAIEDIVVSTGFNDTIQVSDIISQLYRIPEITVFMDYIAMPIIFFTADELQTYTDEELMELADPEYKQSILYFNGAKYPVLAKCVIKDVE